MSRGFARLLEAAARRAVQVDIAIAIVLAIVATSYVVWALIDTREAQAAWWLYAIVVLILSVWNLLVYWGKVRRRHDCI